MEGPDQMNPMPATQVPLPPVDVMQPPQYRRLITHPADAVVFDDDEQVAPAAGTPPASAGRASNGAVVVKTHTDYSAIARDSSHDNFTVLVHLKAPGRTEAEGDAPAPRAPLDLVTVLDVSSSMRGSKLALLKQAMLFVIGILGPDDRLCIISFSSRARRVTRLVRMSDAGKALCARALETLVARNGGTNIAEGLRTAAKALDERRYTNGGVSSVVLLSDGQDNYTSIRQAFGRLSPNYAALVPPYFARTSGDRTAPIHTFGFGSDHDAAAMHVVAEATGGTFSFIENEAVVQDAFAQCVGGLLSVVVQKASVEVACVHPGVRVVMVKAGLYDSRVDEDGRAASIVAGELYAGEERRFLLFLVVPRTEETNGDGDATTLLKVTCVYRDASAGVDVNATAEHTVVRRPEQAGDVARSLEVERELVRVEATEDIAAAKAAAERGSHQEAVEILENRRRAVAQLKAARGGDAMIAALEMELQDMKRRVSSRRSYACSGRAYMLAGMSAHMLQRGSSAQLQLPSVIGIHAGGVTTLTAGTHEPLSHQVASTLPYATPAMLAMLLRSRKAREAAAESGQQQHMVQQGAEGSEPVASLYLQHR
uniref:Uncharacterized protein n=1 Tax=Avena sativa TaxID=4498 RepID=A0ACD5V3R9_AVESA